MEKLYMIKSEARTFLWTSAIGKRVEQRANGVALLDGALIFQDVNGEPIVTIAPGAWLSVAPR